MAKLITGQVVSDKNDKTIVVAVTSRKTHPIYRKQYTVTKRFMAHDEKNEAKVGDSVVIAETLPLSARKRFTLENIVERAAISQDESVDAITEAEAAKKASRPDSKKKTAADEATEEKPAKDKK